MSGSGYIDQPTYLVVGSESEVMPAPSHNGLGDWEDSDPCRYAEQSCRGKLFGALKRCRRRRERSQALCQSHKKALEVKAEFEAEREELTQALQANVKETAHVQQATSVQQQSASTAMNSGLAIGGLALTGAVVFVAMTRKGRKSK